MKKILSLLASASLILFLAGCVSGTGAGVDPTPGDDNGESGAFGDGPTDGALGGAAPSSSGGFDVDATCQQGCEQQDSCGLLDETYDMARCIEECQAELGPVITEASVACQAAYNSLISCMFGLSCEELISLNSEEGEENELGEGPCGSQQEMFFVACWDEITEGRNIGSGGVDEPPSSPEQPPISPAPTEDPDEEDTPVPPAEPTEDPEAAGDDEDDGEEADEAEGA